MDTRASTIARAVGTPVITRDRRRNGTLASPLAARVTDLWTREAPNRRAYLVTALIGVIANILVFGFGHIFGTSAYWELPQEDSRAYLMGYRYFLAEPWHWPLFTTYTMNVPYTKSIVFTDSLPLWALLNKVIATVIPPWRGFSIKAYLGIWHLLNYALQASFGVACLRAVGRRTYGEAILGALFFLSLPAWVLRYGHASLSAHWLSLAALCLYFHTTPRAPMSRRIHLLFLLQLATAAMLNPYHVAMSFALFLAALAKSRSWKSVAVGVPTALASIGSFAALAGFFSREAKVPMGGFELASANLLSPFIPRRSFIFGDGRSLADVNAVIYQYEGYDYLGLGVLILLALSFASPEGARRLGGVIKRHWPLFTVAVLLTLYSLSNHVYFGSKRVLELKVPEKLHWVTEQYRAPGRFVWIPTYIFLVWLLNWAFQRFNDPKRSDRKWLFFVLPALAILQLVDGGLGDWLYIKDYTSRPYYRFLEPHEAWRSFLYAHEAVEIHPPYDCILDGTPFIDRTSQELQYYSSERALAINGVYSARPTRDCSVEADVRRKIKPNDRTAYILLPRVAHLSTRLEALGAECGDFVFGTVTSKKRVSAIGGMAEEGDAAGDQPEKMHGRICSMRSNAIAAARSAGIIVRSTPAPKLELDEKLELGKEENDPFISTGWSWAGEEGRWSQNDYAALIFRLPLQKLEGKNPRLMIESSAPLCGPREKSDIDLLVDGEVVTTLHYDHGSNDPKVARAVPLLRPLSARATLVEFHPHDIRTPKEIGCNDDRRQLGIQVVRIWVSVGEE